MNKINRILVQPAGRDLQRIVEPLANYICATDKPKRALLSALAVLFHEVESTNRVALSYFRTFSEN
jgi:hypothetical protein